MIVVYVQVAIQDYKPMQIKIVMVYVMVVLVLTIVEYVLKVIQD